MKRRDLLQAGLGTLAVGLPVRAFGAPDRKIRVLCWSEGTAPTSMYPHDISGAVADALKAAGGFQVRTAALADADQGLSDSTLAETDVLFWWGHIRHRDVQNERVDAVLKRVREGGMGLAALHSSHYAKPFRRVLEASGNLGGVGIPDAPEQIVVKAPMHPIARGIKDFQIPKEEFYNEPFSVPEPDLVIFESTWSTGQRFRSGCLWRRGQGQVFYFRPGHETFPTFFQPEVKTILVNAARFLGQQPEKIQITQPD
jgi:trehalose utilization protein